MELILTGRLIDAQEAERLRAGDAVVPARRPSRRRSPWLPRSRRMPPLAVAAAKRAINEAYDATLDRRACEERQAFFDLFATVDQKEGMAAFVEKRPPRWTGR